MGKPGARPFEIESAQRCGGLVRRMIDVDEIPLNSGSPFLAGCDRQDMRFVRHSRLAGLQKAFRKGGTTLGLLSMLSRRAVGSTRKTTCCLRQREKAPERS